MENLKIKVNNEAESKEAQELFFKLGYRFQMLDFCRDYNSVQGFTDGSGSLFSDHDTCSHKEITLHELRTLVALKKNPNVEPVITGIGLADSVKHWEKVREMKEYINKTTGEYRKTAEKVTGEQWVELPPNAHTATTRNGEVVFWDANGDRLPKSNKDFDIKCHEAIANLGASILWQRPSQTEPLPFIDDEFIDDKKIYTHDELNRMSDDDVVNHPNHYTQGKVECIDALESATVNKVGIEAICTANAIKYLWRYEEKNGLEDVKKAQWYINKLIDVLQQDEHS